MEETPFESLLRVAFSAIAAATRDAWSVPEPMGIEAEFKRTEASGSFSKAGGGNEGGAAVSGR